MKRVYAQTTYHKDLEHNLNLLQQCGYMIDNVFQNHYTSYGESRETYTIIYERDEAEERDEVEQTKILN